MPAQSPNVVCRLCSVGIHEYFNGDKLDALCERCKNHNNSVYPFTSFDDLGAVGSLFSHWIPFNYQEAPDLISIPSFRSHFVQMTDLRDDFHWMIEIMQELCTKMERQERALEDRCQTS